MVRVRAFVPRIPPAVEAVLQDLRHACRGLVRAPAFTATVVITLALGIGANAAMFAVIDRLMFRPFPYMHDPGTVNRVYIQSSYRGTVNTRSDMPYARYLDMRRDTHTFAQYSPVSEWRFVVGTGQDARIRRVAGVGAEFWGFFDARPALGRWFTPAEDSVPYGTRVAVLGYGFWKSEFGGRDVLNERIQVGPALYHRHRCRARGLRRGEQWAHARAVHSRHERPGDHCRQHHGLSHHVPVGLDAVHRAAQAGRERGDRVCGPLRRRTGLSRAAQR